jgi:hypothetical protein
MFVPNRVIRRRPNRVIGVGVAYVAGHGVHDALESAGIGLANAASPAAAKSCRGQRQSGNPSSPGARWASGVCA